MIWLDVTDLLEFLDEVGHVTGIQRVQIALLERALNTVRAVAIVGAAEAVVQPIILHGPQGKVSRSVLSEDVDAVLGLLKGEQVDAVALRLALRACFDNSQTVDIAANDIFVLTGAFWNYPFYVTDVANLASRGTKIVVVAYDIIPIIAPEYCVEQLARHFQMAFSRIAPFVSLFMCISEYTALTVKAYLAEHGLTGARVEVFPLGHSLDKPSFDERTAQDTKDSLIARDHRFLEKRFCLSVGTIEGRKNLGFLCDVWKELRVQLGPANVPDLILAGRPGWNVENLLQIIAIRNMPDKYIHIIHGLTDAELELLYHESELTLFPSVLEGWGLPVGEALCRGKVCIASNTSSIPEVGGEFADYIDPLNIRDTVSKVASYIQDPAKRRAREAHIRANFVPRGWDEVWEDFAAKVRPLVEAGLAAPDVSASPLPSVGARFAEGQVYRISDDRGFPNEAAMALIDNWYGPESWGIWSAGARSTVRLMLGGEGVGYEGPAEVDLQLKAAPWLAGMEVDIFSGGIREPLALTPLRRLQLGGAPSWFRIIVTPVAGQIELTFRCLSPVVPSDGVDSRALGIGFSSFCWLRSGTPENLLIRLRSLEQRTLGQNFEQSFA
ncbi:hypothetical protein sos41_12600 [Alphaproteobacteria bacterium SO-S41]|nr:hypothetical protein sos41_12600 [Alphaproteobacteria bacterium SO-S41]